MKILYTAFEGENNSSKILLDNIKTHKKLYLVNEFEASVKQLENELKYNNYNLIISFGQAEIEKDTVRIEKFGKNGENILKTEYDISKIRKITEKEYRTEISDDASNYLCNNIYYNGLKYIKENSLICDMIFIHIPMIKKITNINKMAELFSKLEP